MKYICPTSPAENKETALQCYARPFFDMLVQSLYPEPDSPIYYDRSGMVTNFNVSAIYLSWLVTKSMPYS